MLRIYSIVITILCFTAPAVMYYFISDSVTKEVTNKQNEIVKIKSELDVLKKDIWSKVSEIDNLKLENTKNIESLENKNQAIKVLEEDFRKIMNAKNEWITRNSSWELVIEQKTCPICPVCPIHEECKKAEANTNSCVATNINEKIEYDALAYFYSRQVWTSTMPYVKWSDIPDLSTLYLTTQNKNIKNIIEFACPKPYYTESYRNREFIVNSILKWYCNNKMEKCSEEVKNRIQKIKSDISRLPSVWIQFITRYNNNNPSDYTERAIVYYNEYWDRICAWRWIKPLKWNEVLYKLNL